MECTMKICKEKKEKISTKIVGLDKKENEYMCNSDRIMTYDFEVRKSTA